MIDWYLVGFLFMLTLLISLPYFGSYQKISEYTIGGVYSINEGTTLIVIHVMSPFTIMLCAQIILNHGVLAGLALALTGFLTISFYSSIAKLVVDQNMVSDQPFLEWLSVRAPSPLLLQLGIAMMVTIHILSILLFCTLLEKLMDPIFPYSIQLLTLLLVLFSFIFSGLGGITSMNKISRLLLPITFAVLAFLPLSLLLVKGIKPLYVSLISSTQGTQFISWPKPILVWYLILFSLTTLSFLLSNLSLWNSIFASKKERLLLMIRLSGFFWTAVPFTLCVVILFMIENKNTDFSLILLEMKISPHLFFFIIFTSLSIFAFGFSSSIKSLMDILFYFMNRKKAIKEAVLFKPVYIIGLLSIIIILGTHYIVSFSLQHLQKSLIFFLINFLFPILYLVYSRYINLTFTALIAVVPILFFLIVYLIAYSFLFAILSSIISGVVFLLISWILNNGEFSEKG